MSWFGSKSTPLDLLIEKATDESIPFGETDLATSLEITDIIRSKQVQPKDAMRSLKKRLTSTTNPNTQISTLHLIDTCVKNGGAHFIAEISSREFIDSLVAITRSSKTQEKSRDLSLSLIQSWALAFKDNFQFKYVVTTYEHLKQEGYDFPDPEAPITSVLFDSSAPPEWEDSDACMICSTAFSMLNRKHHCRQCGGVFCQAHSSKILPLPHLGITVPVRVCDTCYDELHAKQKSSKKKHHKSKHQSDVYRARAQYDSDDDDDDLKRALALSLRESQGYTETPIPIIPPPKNDEPATANVEEDDEDMKAAIAASLRDLEERKLQANTGQQQIEEPVDNSPYASLLPQSASKYQAPSYTAYDQPYQRQSQLQSQPQPQYHSEPQPTQNLSYQLSPQEANDIRQFASKVDEYKYNASLDPNSGELSNHYRKAIPLTPKLSSDLNDSINKYDKFIDMNSKIDTIMKIYNKLLDERIERDTFQRQNYYQQPSQPMYAANPAPHLETPAVYPPSSQFTQQAQTSYTAPYAAPHSPYEQRQQSIDSYSAPPSLEETQQQQLPHAAYQQYPVHQNESSQMTSAVGGSPYTVPPEEDFPAPVSTPGHASLSVKDAATTIHEPVPLHIPSSSSIELAKLESSPTVENGLQSQDHAVQQPIPLSAHNASLVNHNVSYIPVPAPPPQYQKITDLTFPSVPVSKPPVVQPVVNPEPKEEALIEL